MSALEEEWAYGSSKIITGKSQEQSGYYGWGGGAKTKGSTSNWSLVCIIKIRSS